jgi:hypothetical protein
MVKQVPIVGSLLIAQGVLEAIAGLFYAAMGPMMRAMLQGSMQRATTPEGTAQLPPGFANYMALFYVGGGLLVLGIGVLRIVAGVRNLKYRGRGLGIAALACGVASFLTCYCMPTSLALLIYGLIVYLNTDVARAFEMGERGVSPEEIKAAFP